MKQRNAANSSETCTNTNEKVLRDCHRLYIEEDQGLIAIAKSVDIDLLPPRKKITIMLMGNHSAGKSSFVNWYVEEHIQKTGVAIETQGFTIVTSGKKRESLLANATFHLYSHLRPLQDLDGVTDYVTTEISTSKQKKFGLVMFVDTPGLVDGDMSYPFDVNTSLEYLGGLCDLIFVFFDPIGQALCKRTLNIVEQLNVVAGDRMKFFLSKADTAGSETDRQRVLMQITQELCKRPGLNKCGFDMSTIFVPSLIDKPARCENQIDSVCKVIDKTINQTIQNTLNKLEQDCDVVNDRIEVVLQTDRSQGYANFKSTLVGWFFFTLSTCIAILLAARFFSFSFLTQIDEIEPFLTSLKLFWEEVPPAYEFQARLVLAGGSLIFLLASKLFSRKKETLSRKARRLLQSKKDYIESTIRSQKVKLYNEYLQQSVSDGDLS